MLSSTPITLDAFHRLPRQYRVFRSGEHCHPEDAASLQDDTPLLAIWVGERVPLLLTMAASSGAGR
jgi:hypothetical protein